MVVYFETAAPVQRSTHLFGKVAFHSVVMGARHDLRRVDKSWLASAVAQEVATLDKLRLRRRLSLGRRVADFQFDESLQIISAGLGSAGKLSSHILRLYLNYRP